MSELTARSENLAYGVLYPHANAYFEGNLSETIISVIDQFEVINGVFATSEFASFTVGTDGKMTYIGDVAKHFHIVCNLSMTAVLNNQIASFKWYKNGSIPLPAAVERKISTGADIGAVSIHSDAMLSKNDYIMLKVTNKTTASNIIVKNIYYFALGMPI